MRGILALLDKTLLKQETEHDRYTLGLLIGGSEGQALVALASKGLLECGISDPKANMRGYIPELMREH